MKNNSDEIIKRILTERLSVSDNVVEAADHIKEQLLNGYSTAKVLGKKKVSAPNGENGIPTIITFKRLQIKADGYVRQRIVDANDIICKFIEFENEQAYDALSSQVIDYGGINRQTLALTVNIPVIDGIVQEKLLGEILMHEFEHLYQIGIGKKNMYSRLTRIASQHFQFKDWYERRIAYVLYFFGVSEMDANINELYRELMNEGPNFKEGLKKCNTYQEYNNVLNSYNKIIALEPMYLQMYLLSYNIDNERFISYVTKQRKYFENRIRKVYARCKDDYEAKMRDIQERREYLKKHPLESDEMFVRMK